jgi:hypothetical protein
MKVMGNKITDNSTRRVARQLNLRILPFLVVALAILYVLTNFRGWLVFFIGTAGAWLIAPGRRWVNQCQNRSG